MISNCPESIIKYIIKEMYSFDFCKLGCKSYHCKHDAKLKEISVTPRFGKSSCGAADPDQSMLIDSVQTIGFNTV